MIADKSNELVNKTSFMYVKNPSWNARVRRDLLSHFLISTYEGRGNATDTKTLYRLN